MSNDPGNNREEVAGPSIPDGICPEPSASFAVDPISTAEEAVSVLVFRVKSAWFALKTSLFHRVADIAPLHRVPGKTDKRFLGIVNAGGELELCFSLADILGIPDGEGDLHRDDRPRLVVFGEEKNRFAFAVDEIQGVRSINPRNPATLPVTTDGLDLENDLKIVSLDGQKVGLLNEEKLLAVLKRSLPDGDG